jgi:hypothetical protein
MVMLVSLDQAKDHLRIDNDAEDNDLVLKIKGASRAVMRYLKDTGTESFTDSFGDVYEDSNGVALNVPEDIQSATLLMLGYLHRDRDGDTEKAYTMGFLPAAVTALLYPLRTPTVA